MITTHLNSPIRIVYGTHELIPDNHTIGYKEKIIPIHVVSDDQALFHARLVALTDANHGRVPHALLQRYGLDPLLTYCKRNELDQVDTLQCEVMQNAVECMLYDRRTSDVLETKDAA